MKKSNILFLLILVFLYNNSMADHKEEWENEVNPGARIKALGGAGVAISDMSSPLYVNPGSMAYDPYGRLSVFYGNLNEGSHFGYMEYIYPFSSSGSLGAGVEARFKDSSNHIYRYSFGMAFSFIKGFSMGVSGKALIKTLEGKYAQDFGIDSGIHVAPFKWLNIGIKGENLMAPELEYEDTDLTEYFTRNIQAGISFFHKKYFNIALDLYAEDIDEKLGEASYKGAYGIEVCPDEALAVRMGVKDTHLCLGLGIVSKNINFDYAIITKYDDIVHFFQCVYNFGLSPSRKEKELIQKEEYLGKEKLYYEGLIYLNMGEVAAAKENVNKYIEKYGTDTRIQGLGRDIEKWLNKVRKEKLGRASDLKKEILKDYYRGKLDQAFIKLENLKLLAPNYEEIFYLEHLLNARVLLEQGKYMEAEKELIEALQINPDSKEVRDLHNRLMEVIKLSE